MEYHRSLRYVTNMFWTFCYHVTTRLCGRFRSISSKSIGNTVSKPSTFSSRPALVWNAWNCSQRKNIWEILGLKVTWHTHTLVDNLAKTQLVRNFLYAAVFPTFASTRCPWEASVHPWDCMECMENPQHIAPPGQGKTVSSEQWLIELGCCRLTSIKFGSSFRWPFFGNVGTWLWTCHQLS